MAEDVLQKALMVFRELEDGGGKYTASIAACFNYIGDIYRIQDRYDEALEYYMKGITVGQGPVRTIPATIAAELGEAPAGGAHYQALFMLGAVLFLITLGLSIAVEYISSKRKI